MGKELGEAKRRGRVIKGMERRKRGGGKSLLSGEKRERMRLG